METVYCTSFRSTVGTIYIASTDQGVCKVSVPKQTRREFFDWLGKHFDDDSVAENKARNKPLIGQLSRYFRQRLAKFTIPLDDRGTPFQRRVWKELQRIPYGQTITYKELARRIGAPKAYQAVGQAVGANPLPILIPCHRVVGCDGSLRGYACGVKTKEFLLRLEGALIV